MRGRLRLGVAFGVLGLLGFGAALVPKGGAESAGGGPMPAPLAGFDRSGPLALCGTPRDAKPCVGAVKSASYDAQAGQLALSWSNPGSRLCPVRVLIGDRLEAGLRVFDGRDYPIRSSCEPRPTSWRGPAEKTGPFTGPLRVNGDFFVQISFVCKRPPGAKSPPTRAQCRGARYWGDYVASTAVKVRAGQAGTTSTPTTTTAPPPPPVDTAKRLEQGQSTTTQCGTGDDGKSVFFEGDSIGLRRQHYLDPGNTLVLPIVISGGSGGLMKWNFFSGGLGGTVYVDGCVLRYTAPASATCSQCSPSISVEFADRTGRDVAFYARLSVTVIFTPPPSLCGREYLQVSLPRGAWFEISDDGGRVFGPFFEPTTFQPIATGPWHVSITYAQPYRGQTTEVVDVNIRSCSFAKVIRG